MLIVSCPKCEKQLLLTELNPEAEGRCPHEECGAEYQLSEVLDQLPPQMEIISSPADLVSESADEGGMGFLAAEASTESDSPFGGLDTSSGSSSSTTSTGARPGPRRKKKQPNMMLEIVKVIGGGVAAILVVLPLTWWAIGRDPFQAGPMVAKILPQVVPEKFHGKKSGDKEKEKEDKKEKPEKNTNEENKFPMKGASTTDQQEQNAIFGDQPETDGDVSGNGDVTGNGKDTPGTGGDVPGTGGDTPGTGGESVTVDPDSLDSLNPGLDLELEDEEEKVIELDDSDLDGNDSEDPFLQDLEEGEDPFLKELDEEPDSEESTDEPSSAASTEEMNESEVVVKSGDFEPPVLVEVEKDPMTEIVEKDSDFEVLEEFVDTDGVLGNSNTLEPIKNKEPEEPFILDPIEKENKAEELAKNEESKFGEIGAQLDKFPPKPEPVSLRNVKYTSAQDLAQQMVKSIAANQALDEVDKSDKEARNKAVMTFRDSYYELAEVVTHLDPAAELTEGSQDAIQGDLDRLAADPLKVKIISYFAKEWFNETEEKSTALLFQGTVSATSVSENLGTISLKVDDKEMTVITQKAVAEKLSADQEILLLGMPVSDPAENLTHFEEEGLLHAYFAPMVAVIPAAE